MFRGLILFLLINNRIASQEFCHQTFGSCSAQPFLIEIISCSFSGYEIRSIALHELIYVKATLTKEVTISRPILNINYPVKYIKIPTTIKIKKTERTTSIVE